MIVYKLYLSKEMREGGEKVDILVAKKKHIQLTEAQAVKYIAHIMISPSIAPADITNRSPLSFLLDPDAVSEFISSDEYCSPYQVTGSDTRGETYLPSQLGLHGIIDGSLRLSFSGPGSPCKILIDTAF